MVNVSPSGEPLFHAWRIPSAIEVTSPTQSSDPDSMEYRESSLDEQEMDIGMMEPKKRERTRTEEVRFHSTQDAVRQYRDGLVLYHTQCFETFKQQLERRRQTELRQSASGNVDLPSSSQPSPIYSLQVPTWDTGK